MKVGGEGERDGMDNRESYSIGEERFYHSPSNKVLIFLAKTTLFVLAATNYSKGR